MDLPIQVPFLSKYKHIIGYTLTAVFCGLLAWYTVASIKDHYWKSIAANQTAQIVQLQGKVLQGDAAIAILNEKVNAASIATKASEERATKAQKKVDILLAKYEAGANMASTDPLPTLPIIPTVFVSLDECTKEVKTLQVDMGAMVEEIKDDRQLIANLETETAFIKEKDSELDSQNINLKQIMSDQSKVISDKDKQLDAKDTKIKIWRNTAIGALAAVLALLL